MLGDAAWGFGLWLLGYALGMLFFPFVPVQYIGLAVTPLALAAAIWVCVRQFKGKGDSVLYLLGIGFVWLLTAFLFDYLFLVQAFSVQNYYDYDVLFYYLATLALPLFVGRWGVRSQMSLF